MIINTDETQANAVAAGPEKIKPGEIGRVIVMATVIVGAALLLRMTPWGRQWTDATKIQAWLHQWGPWAGTLYVVLGTVLLSFGVPRVLFSMVGGAMFGVFYGTLLASVVTTISAIPPFYYTRFLGREVVARRMGGRLQRFNAMLEHHGFMVILLLRLCPVGNAFIMNCLAGLSRIRFRSYIGASGVGFLPMTVIFVIFGSSMLGGGSASSFHIKLISGAGLLIAFSLLFIWYFKHSSLARDVMSIMREGKKG